MPDNLAPSDLGKPSEQKPDQQTKDAFSNEIRDAAALLEFAVAQGRSLDPTLIPRIKQSQGYLAEGAPWPSDKDRSDFEAAYRDLAQAMQPVTAASLRATEYLAWGSPATHFSRRLYIVVFLCAAAIVAAQLLPANQYPILHNAEVLILPFIIGLVGALSYLLRSAHLFSYTLPLL